MKHKISVLCTVLLAGFTRLYANTDSYNGNGLILSSQGAFNGGVGGGNLSLTDDGTNVFGTFTKGAATGALLNNSLTIYIDSVTGGFASTTGFKDTQDGNRKAISGYNNTTQFSLLTFTNGFLPDYALSLEPYTSGGGGNFGGLWQLNNGGAGSLGFKQNISLSPLGNSNAVSYTFSFSLANIGLTPGAGQTFSLFGTFDSATGNRSGEAIAGNLAIHPVFTATNTTTLKGFIPFVQTDFDTFTTTTIPEPATLSLVGFGAVAILFALRRR